MIVNVCGKVGEEKKLKFYGTKDVVIVTAKVSVKNIITLRL